MKTIRTTIGILLIIASVVFAIIPGSIFITIAGLVLLAMDYPRARGLLKWSQKRASKLSILLDAWLRNRKHSRY
ncbi:tellurium resistance protein TerC [Glaciecola sp. 1036]|uniref:tellurium resistance protein TerC n=1 Tax=Alteromonadaceae TaxID=72275 RepID=UPI003D06BAEA